MEEAHPGKTTQELRQIIQEYKAQHRVWGVVPSEQTLERLLRGEPLRVNFNWLAMLGATPTELNDIRHRYRVWMRQEGFTTQPQWQVRNPITGEARILSNVTNESLQQLQEAVEVELRRRRSIH